MKRKADLLERLADKKEYNSDRRRKHINIVFKDFLMMEIRKNITPIGDGNCP